MARPEDPLRDLREIFGLFFRAVPVLLRVIVGGILILVVSGEFRFLFRAVFRRFLFRGFLLRSRAFRETVVLPGDLLFAVSFV